MKQPDLATVPPFYRGYVNLVKDYEMMEIIKLSNTRTLQVVRSIPEDKGEYRYALGKWSIKELLCHMMDAERIFAYRALRFARNDKTELAGFEETNYAAQANAHSRTIKEISDEMERLRFSTLDLYKSFNSEMLLRKGTANNTEVSVLNLGYIVPGHETHHTSILKDRYLI